MRIRILSFSILMTVIFLISMSAYAEEGVVEISGSPFETSNAPIPAHVKSGGEKLVLVDPRQHAWGAYDERGKLVRWGIATTGANWCSDIQRPCRTNTGTFRIYSVGDASCVSSKYPVAEGGASMPFCMYFSKGQALHGAFEVPYGSESHGCVRIHISDAKWLRYNFVEGPMAANGYRGTRVIVKSY